MTSHALPMPENLFRYSGSALAGVLITAALLWIMQDLIRHHGSIPEAAKPIVFTAIVPTIEEVEIKRDRKPEPPPPPEPAPEQVLEQPKTGFDVDGIGGDVTPPAQRPELDIERGGLPDGDMLPIVKVAPVYPNRAATRGIEGFVLMEFTVDETGAVLEPRIVESSPAGVFDRSALNAVLRFKYKPRVVNGAAVRVQGVLHRLTFELNET